MDTWRNLAPSVIQRLSQDLGITPQQAAGIVGQLGHESAGLQAINEYQPVVPGSRGGFGWAQWTGPRRRQFESWAQSQGLDVTDPEANYGFLIHELTNTPEKRALEAVRASPDAISAGRAFTDTFLRPGTPAYKSRDSWVERALNFISPPAHAATMDNYNQQQGEPQAQSQTSEQITMRDRVERAKAAGYTDEQILARLQANEGIAQRFQKARDAGYSDADIYGRLGLSIGQQQELQPSQAQEDPQEAAKGGGFWRGVGMGIRDPLDAGAQMLSRALDDTMVGRGINSLGNQLASLGLVEPTNSSADVDAIVNKVNDEYEAARKARGRDGFDGGRIIGNIAGTAPLGALRVAQGATLAPAMINGAVQGGAFGLLQPVLGDQQDNFVTSKVNQGLLGAGSGAAGGALAHGLGRVLAPKAGAKGSQAMSLLDEGVELTPGQALGGNALRIEDRAMSLPVVGDAIRGARVRGEESLNKAVYNRVLEPIGKTTNKLGREAIDDISTKIGAAYDDVLSQASFVPDAAFKDAMSVIKHEASGLPDGVRDAFLRQLKTNVEEPLSNLASGQTFKQVESKLGELVKRFSRSNDAFQQEAGMLFSKAQDVLRGGLERSNPQISKELANVNRAYALSVRLKDAATRSGSADGIFSPSALEAAVRKADPTKHKAAFASGRALMQDLAENAKSMMNSQIPNSGTADRAMSAAVTGGLVTGAAFANPTPLIAAGAAALPYIKGVTPIVTRSLIERPQVIRSIGNQLPKLPGGLLAVPMGYQ